MKHKDNTEKRFNSSQHFNAFFSLIYGSVSFCRCHLISFFLFAIQTPGVWHCTALVMFCLVQLFSLSRELGVKKDRIFLCFTKLLLFWNVVFLSVQQQHDKPNGENQSVTKAWRRPVEAFSFKLNNIEAVRRLGVGLNIPRRWTRCWFCSAPERRTDQCYRPRQWISCRPTPEGCPHQTARVRYICHDEKASGLRGFCVLSTHER